MREIEKVRFEAKTYYDDDGMMGQGIFVDGQLFDWGVDPESYKEATKMGPKFQRAVYQDIVRHFLDSISEFMGREVRAEEVEEATKTGWIAK